MVVLYPINQDLKHHCTYANNFERGSTMLNIFSGGKSDFIETVGT